jgi:hypothetical protein
VNHVRRKGQSGTNSQHTLLSSYKEIIVDDIAGRLAAFAAVVEARDRSDRTGDRTRRSRR